MTQAPHSAPAGWYPSPDGAPVQRWWDGVMWTDATVTAEPAEVDPRHDVWEVPAISGWVAPEPPRAGALGLLTRVAVALAGLAAPLAAGARVWRRADPPGWLTDDVALAAAGAALGLLVVAAVTWMVWQYRVADSFPPGATRRPPAWHVGSWLVPVGALWLPWQNVADLFALSIGRRPAWLTAWWTLWVAGGVTAVVGWSVPWVVLVGSVLFAASAPFAWLVVERLTEAIGSSREHPGD